MSFAPRISLAVLLASILVVSHGLCPGLVLSNVETGLNSGYAVFARPFPAGTGSTTKLKMPSECNRGLLANSKQVCCITASGASILCKSLQDALRGIDSPRPSSAFSPEDFRDTIGYYLDWSDGLAYIANTTSRGLLIQRIDFSADPPSIAPAASLGVRAHLLVPSFNRSRNSHLLLLPLVLAATMSFDIISTLPLIVSLFPRCSVCVLRFPKHHSSQTLTTPFSQ